MTDVWNVLGANGGGGAEENVRSEARGVLFCLQVETGETGGGMV